MDTFALIAAERRRLADELETLGAEDWTTPSLCEGWTNHVVAAHINLGWAGSKVGLVANLVRARGNLDQAMDRSSRRLAETLSPAECVKTLRDQAENRFVPPTLTAASPLTDVVLHGGDMLHPLGRSVDVAGEALVTVLDFVTSPRGSRGLGAVSLDGLVLEATDVDWRRPAAGSPDGATSGALLRGPALALAGFLVGRREYLADLTGDGVAVVASRLRS